MTTRGTLYRCHLFSFGGPQSAGIESRWTHDLVPIGDAEVLSGEEVELYANVDAILQPITPQSRIRFDILEEDFLLTGGLDDRVVSLVGTGASVAESEFPVHLRTTVFRGLAAGEEPRNALVAYRQVTPGYRDDILVLTEWGDADGGPPAEGGTVRASDGAAGSESATGPRPVRHHVIGWWVAERLEDWANAEMYFIVAIDDVEDKSEETIDVSPDRAPTEGPALPWTVTSSVRRLHALLKTGAFDWSVNATEVGRALQILRALRPEALMQVIAFLKIDGTWQKLLRALDKHDPDALTDLQMELDPDLRFLLPGDTIRVTIHSGAVLPDQTTIEPVRHDGIHLYRDKLVVNVVGLQPQDAANEIAKALLDGYIRRPVVEIAVTKRGHHYLDSRAPSGNITFTSKLKIDTNTDEYRRELKWSRFTAYIAPLKNPTGRTLSAVLVYLDWIGEHRQEEAFLTREPEELWEWALRQTEPPPPSPVMKFLELYTSMTAGSERLPSRERAELIETASRYMRWLDANDSPATLEKTSPIEIWSRMATQVMIERLREEDRKREAALRERREQIDIEAAGKKLDEAIALMIRYVWRVREPYIVEARSEGVGYLVMPSEFEKEVRDVIATAFLNDVMRMIGNDDLRPRLLRTPMDRVFTEWMDARADLKEALWLATTYPYVEKYAIEVDIPAWQLAIEIGVSLIPVIGNLVSLAEAGFGYSITLRKLTTVERAISGAAVVLPFAVKTAKATKGVITAHGIVKTYGLAGREANALYRAAIPVAPGSPGEKLLRRLLGDIDAGKGVKDADSIRAAEKLLGEMGMFDRATLEAFGVLNVQALRGAALAGVVETQEWLAKILGHTDLASAEFRALSSASKEAVRAAVRREPELLRKAIMAETDTGLKRYGDHLVEQLAKGGMPADQADALRKAAEALSLKRRTLIGESVEKAVKSGTDPLLVQRLDDLGKSGGLRHEGAVWMAALQKRAAHHQAAGNAERARQIKREIDRIKAWFGDADDVAKSTALANEARLLADAISGSKLAFRVREGAGNTLQYLWLRFRMYKMPGPLTAAQAREAFVEYAGHASKNFLGNYGEFEVAFRLGRTHVLLKAPDGLVNLPGTDLVAIPRTGGPTLIIDNKALNREQVDSVTALTKNLGKNFLDDLDEFVKLAGAGDVPAHLKLTINRMTRARAELASAGLLKLTAAQRKNEVVQKQIADILKKHDIHLVVSNAGGQVTSVSDDLAEIGIDLLELNLPVKAAGAVTP